MTMHAKEKSDRAFRTIGEASKLLDLPQHVLRFWETRFSQIKPLKRGGNRRYYRPEDIALLKAIKTLLYDEGMTIKGVQKRLREQGVRALVDETTAGDRLDGARASISDAAIKAPSHMSAPPVSYDKTQETGATEGRQPSAETLQEILDELKNLRRLLD